MFAGRPTYVACKKCSLWAKPDWLTAAAHRTHVSVRTQSDTCHSLSTMHRLDCLLHCTPSPTHTAPHTTPTPLTLTAVQLDIRSEHIAVWSSSMCSTCKHGPQTTCYNPGVIMHIRGSCVTTTSAGNSSSTPDATLDRMCVTLCVCVCVCIQRSRDSGHRKRPNETSQHFCPG